MTASDLITRAMLVSLSIGAWGATKDDKQAAAETAKVYGAKPDSGKYTKRLMPKGDNAYSALKSHIASMRVMNYAQTLAWSDDGKRLLSVKNYQSYVDAFREGKHRFDALLDELVAAYPSLKQQAIDEATEEAVRTNNPRRLLTESDFPADIRAEYSWAIEFFPVPCGGDFRVTISQEEIEQIANRVDERVKADFEAAHHDAVNRLYKVVQKIQSTLSEPDAIFRDSLIQNARDLCDVLTRITVSEDPALETVRRETELLAQCEPQVLRDVPDVRIETANRAQSILDAMTATYGASTLS